MKSDIKREGNWRCLALHVFASFVAIGAIWFSGCANDPSKLPRPPQRVSVTITNYRGWSDSYLLRNGTAEVVVVPQLGRIMQFGFRGEEGVFWENQKLTGKALDCETAEWINFGGDKTWPAPEGDWSKITGKSYWHPPPAFDCMPLVAEIVAGDVVLTSPSDPYYGVRVQRTVHLDPMAPILTIRTSYERGEGRPLRIGIWTITQLKDPAGVFASLNGQVDAVLLGKERPPTLTTVNGLASLRRDASNPYKIGLQSGELLWIGSKEGLLITSPRSFSGEYPDKGSSSEIYTNPDPWPYVELEMLGPLSTLRVGETISQTNRYQLFRRVMKSPLEEAHRVLRLNN